MGKLEMEKKEGYHQKGAKIPFSLLPLVIASLFFAQLKFQGSNKLSGLIEKFDYLNVF